MKLVPIALVAAGGAIGSVARYLVGVAIQSLAGDRWPWGTFAINVSGCFIIGFFLTLSSERVIIHENWRYLVPIGFVGAYTTFSTYQYETLRLIELGAWIRALAYVLASTIVGFIAVALAANLARRY
jgi:CrcB protein